MWSAWERALLRSLLGARRSVLRKQKERRWRGGGEGDELQPASPRRAGSGGAAPRHRAAFVRVIIMTLSLCCWSYRLADTLAPPFITMQKLSLYPKRCFLHMEVPVFTVSKRTVHLNTGRWDQCISKLLLWLNRICPAFSSREGQAGEKIAQVSANHLCVCMCVCGKDYPTGVKWSLSQNKETLPGTLNAFCWLELACQNGGSVPAGLKCGGKLNRLDDIVFVYGGRQGDFFASQAVFFPAFSSPFEPPPHLRLRAPSA